MNIYIAPLNSANRKTASRFIVGFAYHDIFSRNMNAAMIHKNQYGKPYYDDTFYFNVSHSKNYICVVTDRDEVGIDIEEPRYIDTNMQKRILSKSETVLDGDILNNWVLKEAYTKFLGLGLNIDFRDISANDIMEHENVTNLSTDKYVCFVVSKKTSDVEITYLKEEDLVKTDF